MFNTGYFDQADPYTMPAEYQQMLDDIAPGLAPIIEQQTVTPTEDWRETWTRALSLVVMTEQQRRLMNIQLDRARAGLPPLKASEYSAGLQLDVGLEKAVMLGAAALLVAWLVLRK